MPVPSQRLQDLPAYPFAVIGQQIRQMVASGLDVVRLDIGSPDGPPPDMVIDALEESARHPGHHGYSGYTGTPGYRKAVADYYRKRFAVELNPDTEILPLLGSKEGLVNLAMAYAGPGDIILVPDISYPSYAMGAYLAGADVHWVSLRYENGFLPDLTTIPDAVAERAKILWVNYPNNPTGATAGLDFYERAVAWCKEHDILLASDNPYPDVMYDGHEAGSALEVPGAKEIAIEFFSLSKTFNMAGWRLGAALGNATALKNLLQVKSNLDSGHFRAVYDAGVIALEQTSQEWIDARNRVYQARRDRIVAAAPEIGLEADRPKGSMYIWARVRDGDGQSYVKDALQTAHVSLAPGNIYGPGGPEYVRFSLGTADERLDVALQRLKSWYAAR